jgi:hypothetical protein
MLAAKYRPTDSPCHGLLLNSSSTLIVRRAPSFAGGADLLFGRFPTVRRSHSLAEPPHGPEGTTLTAPARSQNDKKQQKKQQSDRRTT